MEFEGSFSLNDVEIETIRDWVETRLEYLIEAPLPDAPEALVHFLPPVEAIRMTFLEACRAGIPTVSVLSQLLAALAFALDHTWPDDDELFDLDAIGMIPAA